MRPAAALGLLALGFVPWGLAQGAQADLGKK